MIFPPRIWRRIAIVLSVGNVAGIGYAVASNEPWHAAVHVALALGFGLWAVRLGESAQSTDSQAQVQVLEGDRLEALEAEMSRLRQELSETQERLDFTERVLAQGREPRRVEPER